MVLALPSQLLVCDRVSSVCSSERVSICDGISIEVFLQGKYYDKLSIVSRGESSSYHGLVLLLLTTMGHCKG